MSDLIDVDADISVYDYDWGDEPRYKTWRDEQGAIHVEVEDGWSEYVVLEPNGQGKFKVVFDSHKVPF